MPPLYSNVHPVEAPIEEPPGVVMSAPCRPHDRGLIMKEEAQLAGVIAASDTGGNGAENGGARRAFGNANDTTAAEEAKRRIGTGHQAFLHHKFGNVDYNTTEDVLMMDPPHERGLIRRTSETSNSSSRSRVAMFPPPEDDIKLSVREALKKPKYNVANFYHETGIWACIATHPVFENLTLAVITLNALWIWIDTDYNHAPTLLQADTGFQLAEHLFCLYFSFEWFVRFCAFERKRNGLRDAWFVFDTCLVLMMVVETWVVTLILLSMQSTEGSGGMGNASILRIFRLLRLSRLARMLRSMPELMILIKGMVAATRSVFFTLCLLFILLYVFAILMTQLTDGSPIYDPEHENYFKSIPTSMYSLLLYGTFLDNLGPVMADIMKVHVGFAFLFLVFIALSALMVMNMLIGVLCEVVQAVATTEKEEMLLSFVKNKMQQIVRAIDVDGGGTISKVEFKTILKKPEAILALDEVGVDPIGLVDFIDFIFEDENHNDPDVDTKDKELTFNEFMDVVLEFRGCNKATVKDIHKITRLLRNDLKMLTEKVDNNNRLSPRTRAANTTNGSAGFRSGSAERPNGNPHSPSKLPGGVPERPMQETYMARGSTATSMLPNGTASGPEHQGPTAVRTVRRGPQDGGGEVPAHVAEAVQRAEAFLIAGQSELQRLLQPGAVAATLTGGSASPEGSAQLKRWASKAQQGLADNLDELRRVRSQIAMAATPAATPPPLGAAAAKEPFSRSRAPSIQ
mmetsp:Transcript_13072/g.33698  ORF Transcript_13072/g.33698 Transcript_13072/m.33698 type:complete len:742 (+) Transcript_13072:107-2332(+)